jgi:uncharacterized protein YvpB
MSENRTRNTCVMALLLTTLSLQKILMVFLAVSALLATGCDEPRGGASSTQPVSAATSSPAAPSSATAATASPSGSTAGESSGFSLGDSFSFDRADSSQATQNSASTGSGSVSGASGSQGTVEAFGGKALNVPLINQNTGGGRYPGAYCGPTSVRMVLGYFGTNIDAETAASGVYIRGQGASHEGMARKLRSYGLKANMTYTHSLASLQAAVGRGHPVIVNVRGDYGPRTTGGHIIVVVGFDGSGNPIINDPAGGGRHVCPKRKFLGAWNGLMIEASK